VKSFGGTANVQFFAVQLQSGKQTVWRAWPVGYAPTAHCLGAKRLCGYGAFSPSASMPVHG
jgi:hypothetical protein